MNKCPCGGRKSVKWRKNDQIMANVTLNNMLQSVDNANDQFAGVITKTEKAIFDSAVGLIKQLDIDGGGFIKNTTANLKLLSEIKVRLARIANNKEYLKGVKELAEQFDTIYKTQVAYYSNAFAQKTLGEHHKSKFEAMKRVAVANTIEGLTGAGLQTNVLDQLNKMLLKAVTSGAKYSDLVANFKAQLITSKDSTSSLAKYAGTYATTAMTQYAGQNNKLFTDDLGTEWFEYVGSTIETTREFCNVVIEHHPYIHVSEIPDLLKGKIKSQKTGELIEIALNPKTGLPKGMIDDTTPENFQINVGGWNCRHQLVPIAKEVVPNDIRMPFDKDAQEELKKKAEEEAKQKKIADLKAKLLKYSKWVDTPALQIGEALHAGDIPALEGYLAQMQSLESKALQLKLIEDPLTAMESYTYEELKAVNMAVAAKIAGWSGESLEYQQKKLQFEANWVAENKKYPTWQVAESAYNKKLAEVQKEMALYAVKGEYFELMDVKTKSPTFKQMLVELAQALTDEDVAKAQMLIGKMKANIAYNEKRRARYAEGKLPKVESDFDDDAYSQKRKDAALWAQDTQSADGKLRSTCGEAWQAATGAEKDAIFGYTSSYHNIQEPLRGMTYYGSETDTKRGLKRIPLVERIINRSSYDFDMWVQRGDDKVALKKFGLLNYATATDEEIKALVGRTGTEAAFWSAGVAKGKGFTGKPIIFNIYMPKGTKAMYCEPFSAFGCGNGRNWDGVSGQTRFGGESEILLQRGTTMRVTKVQKSGSTWYIDVEVIKQQPLPFPYTNGYPYPY